MGLLLDFSPEKMMASNGEDDQELEAEFLAIVGGQPDPNQKPNGKSKWTLGFLWGCYDLKVVIYDVYKVDMCGVIFLKIAVAFLHLSGILLLVFSKLAAPAYNKNKDKKT